ncbi:hypothetical protein EIP91_003900 [Steccherinum ochraceum]|uniref:DUF6533 domain-containing protein n=1 Tax=Steccherinum ochraceum TaxID=92696 RepID=A0A4R0RD04_9APHY|nr:hypothetical protein EIP91_003900 [Steccherinum ochraceum]
MSQVAPNTTLIPLNAIIPKYNDPIFPNSVTLVFAIISTLFCYDFVLTIPDEVRLVWNQKLSGASVLFLVNRYLVAAITVITGYLNLTVTGTCINASILSITWQFVIITFIAVRVYAIWNGDWRVFAVVFTAGLAMPVEALYFLISQHRPPVSEAVRKLPLFAVSLTSIIAVDAVALALTWVKTASLVRLMAKVEVKLTLTTMLLRDGTVYFCVLIVMKVLFLFFFRVGDEISDFAAMQLYSIMTSHFILNLRGIYSQPTSDTPSSWTNMSFARNLGGPLDLGSSSDDHSNFPDSGTWNPSGPQNVSAEPLLLGLQRARAISPALSLQLPSYTRRSVDLRGTRHMRFQSLQVSVVAHHSDDRNSPEKPELKETLSMC